MRGDYLDVALKRQSRFFDAKTPSQLTDKDRGLIQLVASNLVLGLGELAKGKEITISPPIAGLDIF